MKVTVHKDAVAILEAVPSGGITQLTFAEAPPSDEQMHFFVELPGTTEDDPRLEGTREEIELALMDLIEQKKFGDAVLARFSEIADRLATQPLPEVFIDSAKLSEEAAKRRNVRRTWLIEQIESGAFAAIEMLKQEFGETVKIHVEVTQGAA